MPGLAPGAEAAGAKRTSSAATLILLGAIALSLTVMAVAVPAVIRFRDVFPFGDMVDVVWRYFTGPTRAFWIYHDNEHLPIFAMPLYWIDFRLFKAQGSFLIGCNLLLSVAIACAPAPAIRRATRGQPLAASAAIAAILAMNLWLGNYINLIWTKQVHMYLSLFAVTMAIGAAALPRGLRWRHVAVIATWLMIATFSFGYGVIGFPVLLAIGVLRRWRWRQLVVIAAVLVACLAFYLAIMGPTLAANRHTARPYFNEREAALYALTFLASPPFNILRYFVPQKTAFAIAWCLTGLGLIVFAGQAMRCRRQPPGELATWAIGLALFTALAGVETAYARSIFGYAQAADGRYVIGQLPFWVGLVLIGVQKLHDVPWRSAAMGAALALFCVGLLASQQKMLPNLRLHAYERWCSAMSAIDDVADPAVYVRDEMIFTARVPAMIDALRAQKWSAYAWPQRAWIGRSLASFGATQSGCVGTIDTIVTVGETAGRRLQGWAADSRLGDRSQWIVLADESGTIRGLAHAGGPRPDAAGAFHSPGLLYAGWTGYVPYRFAAPEITAYLLVKDKHPCRIGGPPPAAS